MLSSKARRPKGQTASRTSWHNSIRHLISKGPQGARLYHVRRTSMMSMRHLGLQVRLRYGLGAHVGPSSLTLSDRHLLQGPSLTKSCFEVLAPACSCAARSPSIHLHGASPPTFGCPFSPERKPLTSGYWPPKQRKAKGIYIISFEWVVELESLVSRDVSLDSVVIIGRRNERSG